MRDAARVVLQTRIAEKMAVLRNDKNPGLTPYQQAVTEVLASASADEIQTMEDYLSMVNNPAVTWPMRPLVQ